MKDQDCRKTICKQDRYSQFRNLYNANQSNTEQDMSKTSDVNQEKPHECPLIKASLGNFSWSLLHTFAAYYPENPTEDQQRKMRGFLEGFKEHFPCARCRPHFVKDYDRDPPNLSNQAELSLWVCRQHNYVNKLIRKPQVPCDLNFLMKRWRTGCSETQDEL